MRGIFGNMFDMNRDGEIDSFERAMEFDFLEEDRLTELEIAGVDPESLEFMDADERREVLQNAGLDPDDFDF